MTTSCLKALNNFIQRQQELKNKLLTNEKVKTVDKSSASSIKEKATNVGSKEMGKTKAHHKANIMQLILVVQRVKFSIHSDIVQSRGWIKIDQTIFKQSVI